MKLRFVESIWRTRVAVGLIITPLLSCAPPADPVPDLILFNGKILTVDETFVTVRPTDFPQQKPNHRR